MKDNQKIKINTKGKKFGIEVKFTPNIELSDDDINAILRIIQCKTKGLHIQLHRYLLNKIKIFK